MISTVVRSLSRVPIPLRTLAVCVACEECFALGEPTCPSCGSDEYVPLLRELLERSFIGRLDLYNGEQVVVLSEAIEGDSAIVKTHVVTRQGADLIPVDYRMVRRGDHWRACDVVIGGLSLVDNYRAQFHK